MNPQWTKRLLIFAAAWNLIGAASSLADPARHFAQMYHQRAPFEDALALFFYQCTWINVLAWGVAYLVAAWTPASRTAVLLAGGLGKVVYFVVCVALVNAGIGRPLVLAFGLGDLAMAVLFGWALLAPADSHRGVAAWSRS